MGLDQELLSRTIMPLRKYRKTAIGKWRMTMVILSFAKKSESYEICFVPDNDYRGFKTPGQGLRAMWEAGFEQDGEATGAKA